MGMLKKVLRHPFRYAWRLLTTLINVCCMKLKGVECRSVPLCNGLILLSRSKNSRIVIGRHCSLNSGRKCNPVGFEHKMMLTASRGGELLIGNHVGMSNTVIFAMNHVEIGDHVLLGNGVKIYDTDFHSLDAAERRKGSEDHGIVSKPVVIREGAFIGAGSLILKGVTIGQNSIVGAASVVTRSIPDGEVWAGNPARFIRRV